MTVRTVTRRGSPRLVIDLQFRSKDGTLARYRRDAQVQTMAAARAEEKRLQANIARHGSIHEPKVEPEVRLLFADAVSIYLKTKAKALKGRTVLGYESILDSRLIPRFGSTPIHTIGYAEVIELDAELIADGLTESSRRNVFIVLRSVLSHMVRIKKLPSMPALPKLPKPGKKILRTLTTDQINKIMSLSSPTAKVAFGLAIYAGLRAGEVRALRWSDVDRKAGIIVVRLSTCKGITGAPKSGHERPIPIARPLGDLLARLPGEGDALVAVTKQGRPWGEAGLRNAFVRVCKRAKIGHWRFHDLRHYFVSHLFMSGAPATTIQALAGHGSLLVTQRYAHHQQSDLKAAVETAWEHRAEPGSRSDGEQGGHGERD